MLCMVFIVGLSIAFLNKRYSLKQYSALLFVTCGLALVTLTDIWDSEQSISGLKGKITDATKTEKHRIMIGMLALLGGQFFEAST